MGRRGCSTCGLVRGHSSWPPTVSWSSQPKGWVKTQGKSLRCLRCPVHEGVGVKHQQETFRSRRNPDEVGGCAQESASTSRGSTSSSSSCSRRSNGGVTSTASVCTGASSTSPARLHISVSLFHSETPTETRRFRPFMHRGGHRVEVGPADGHEIARGNAAEVARLSSLVVQAATSLQPLQLSMVAQFVSAREFIWSGKRDDSMIGPSARSAAYGHRGSRVGEASNPGPPKSLLVLRVEQFQMSTVVDSDEEPLLHREVRSQFQSEVSPGHIEVSRPPLLQRGGSGFLLFRDAEGMVEGTRFGWVGADHPRSTSEVGAMAKGRSIVQAGDPETQPVSRFQGISAVVAGGERQRSSSTIWQSPPQKPWPPKQVQRSIVCWEPSQRWERAIRIRLR